MPASGTHPRPTIRPRAPSALDDLLFGKSALAHVRLPKERKLPKIGGIYGEQVTIVLLHSGPQGSQQPHIARC